MTRIYAILFLIVLAFGASGQKLLVENKKGKKRKISIGSIVTVTTASDSSTADLFHYVDSIKSNTSYWCKQGCYTLVDIDATTGVIYIQRPDGVVRTYQIAEIKSINFVPTKQVNRIKSKLLLVAIASTSIFILQTTRIAKIDPFQDKLMLSIGALALIGYDVLNLKKSKVRQYKLIGITN